MRQDSHGHDAQRQREVDEATSGWARLDTETILQEMIDHELRAGRLTASQRAQIMRFGAEFGLSAVETRDLINECRDKVLLSADPAERRYARRLLDPPPARIPTTWKMAAAIAVAIAVDVALFLWLF